mgnify:CR=1 FL=1
MKDIKEVLRLALTDEKVADAIDLPSKKIKTKKTLHNEIELQYTDPNRMPALV